MHVDVSLPGFEMQDPGPSASVAKLAHLKKKYPK